MDDRRLEIGQRLREIRNIIHEGGRLSAKQFGQMLGENEDKILNYEKGRAAVPSHLLVELYNRGVNPTYILTGEGSRFALNDAGIDLGRRVEGDSEPQREKSNIVAITRLDSSEMSIDELIAKAADYTAAAGDIMKIISRKSKEDEGKNR